MECPRSEILATPMECPCSEILATPMGIMHKNALEHAIFRRKEKLKKIYGEGWGKPHPFSVPV